MIIIDDREPIKVLKYFEKHNIEYKRKRLEVGDIIVGKKVFERKTWSDLYSSLKDGRFFKQCEELYNYDSCLLIHGNIKSLLYYDRSCNFNWIVSSIASVSGRGIKVVIGKNLDTVLDKMINISNSQEKSIIPIKKNANYYDPRLSVIASFPNIGEKRAVQILKKFGSIENFINNVEKVVEIDGIGKETAEKIIEVVNRRWEDDGL